MRLVANSIASRGSGLRRWALSSVIAAVAPATAYANDTLAVLGAGGLELTTSEHIAMLSEDLHLSPSEVRVRYEFRNESNRDIVARVVFPLPEVDQSATANFELPANTEHNFVDFRVTVDGQSVSPLLEEKAVTDGGTDVTAVLAEAGLPANTHLPGWEDKVRALSDAEWQQLVDHGLFDVGDGPTERDDDVSPLWSLKATYHWEQSFPAGKAITVEHRYQPIKGGRIVYPGDDLAADYRSYCLDAPGTAGVARLVRQAQAADSDAAGIAAWEVGYVLTTGANWKGPIGDFHLTIDKDDPKAVLSLCMSGLRKVTPTTFELRKQNFHPTEDIRFVVFQPAQ